MDLGLEGKRAIVTGGSKGMGLAIAESLAAEGASVAIMARGLEALESAAERVKAAGAPEVIPVGVDMSDPDSIIDAFADVLPAAELGALLDADNTPPVTHLVVRPGLAEVADLGGEPLRWSPFGARADGRPGGLAAVREGRAGVQDEGSQLVAWALARADAPDGPWLDTCAGPGGKAALLAGLARQAGEYLLAAERQSHRAVLVAKAVAGYPDPRPVVVAADGTRPAWPAGSFTRRSPSARVRAHPPATFAAPRATGSRSGAPRPCGILSRSCGRAAAFCRRRHRRVAASHVCDLH